MLQLFLSDIAGMALRRSGGCNFGYLHFVSPVNKKHLPLPVNAQKEVFFTKNLSRETKSRKNLRREPHGVNMKGVFEQIYFWDMAEWLVGEHGMRYGDVECDVGLKTRIFYSRITDMRSKQVKNWSNKSKLKRVACPERGGKGRCYQ